MQYEWERRRSGALRDVIYMIHFKIVSPERVVYEDDVDQITLPAKEGEITLLSNHIPLVASLQAGELVVKKGDHMIPMAISGGVVEVLPGSSVIVLADTAEKVEEIDEKRAEEARARAGQLMKEKVVEAEDYAGLTGKIEKELARLKVARKYRHDRRAPTITNG